MVHKHFNNYRVIIFIIIIFILGVSCVFIGIYCSTSFVDDFWEKVSHIKWEVITHIGTVLIVISILDVVHRLAIDKEFAESIEEIKELFIIKHNIGINNIIAEITPAFFKEKIHNAKNITVIITYIPGADAFMDDFTHSDAYHKGNYNIYLLDNSNDQVNLRHSTLGSNDGIKNGLQETENVLNKYKIKFEKYNSLIAFPIFIFDNIAYVGFYPYHEKAVKIPWIEVEMNGKFGYEIKKHMEVLDNIINEQKK